MNQAHQLHFHPTTSPPHKTPHADCLPPSHTSNTSIFLKPQPLVQEHYASSYQHSYPSTSRKHTPAAYHAHSRLSTHLLIPKNRQLRLLHRRIMANYDTGSLTISSMTAAPNNILRLTTPDATHMLSASMDAFDHDINFDGDGLLDDVNTSSLPPLPFTPSYELDAFSTTFEDPFYQSGTDFSTLLEDTNAQPNNEATGNSGDLDNKLLGFGAPILKAPTLDDAGQTWPAMTAELYGMFFVAEDVFGDNNTTTGRPMELTCYRRNLFQISGNVVLSRSIKSMVNEQGQQIPLYDLSATISALESIEGKSTEIISVPWKTAAAGATSEEKAGTAPAKWPLDLSSNPEVDSALVTIPIAWKRLQFKHATANNGRRKGLQQHYIIQINLTATLATGDTVKLAEIQSGPIIVRGRSPRNFDSRKDVPLSERKLESKQRTMSDASAAPQPPPMKVDPAVANSSYRFYALNALQQPLDLPDWANTPLSTPTADSYGRQAKRPTLSHQSTSSSVNRPPVPKTRWKVENHHNQSLQATAPIDLSLADDEYGRGHPGGHRLSDVGSTSPAMNRDRLGKKGVGSPIEDTDLLYEYFPLSVDDWMPPVDAIYRPHVVHHTVVPPDLKAAQTKSKPKRYFSADE